MATAAQAGETIPSQEKVTFTPEQQERVNELIRDAMGRAGRDARQEAEQVKARLQEIEGQFTTLRTEYEAIKTAKPAKTKEGEDEVAVLRAQIDEIKTAGASREQELNTLREQLKAREKAASEARNEAVQVRKSVAIRDAANKVGFFDLEEVAQLTDKYIRFDEATGRFKVINDDGVDRHNAAFEPMSLEEFYQEYASKKPHLVRTDLRGGVGSTESQRAISSDGKYAIEQLFGPKADAAKANKLALENKQEYRRLKELARKAGLISW